MLQWDVDRRVEPPVEWSEYLQALSAQDDEKRIFHGDVGRLKNGKRT
jgi:aminoglycoside phosphotransferase (APT) family kinase protein